MGRKRARGWQRETRRFFRVSLVGDVLFTLNILYGYACPLPRAPLQMDAGPIRTRLCIRVLAQGLEATEAWRAVTIVQKAQREANAVGACDFTITVSCSCADVLSCCELKR